VPLTRSMRRMLLKPNASSSRRCWVLDHAGRCSVRVWTIVTSPPFWARQYPQKQFVQYIKAQYRRVKLRRTKKVHVPVFGPPCIRLYVHLRMLTEMSIWLIWSANSLLVTNPDTRPIYLGMRSVHRLRWCNQRRCHAYAKPTIVQSFFGAPVKGALHNDNNNNCTIFYGLT